MVAVRRYRLLLQSSAVCRLLNLLREDKEKKDAVVLAYYVDKFYRAEKYIVYQPGGDLGQRDVPRRETVGLFFFSRVSRLALITRMSLSR
jgi:hypothetical protein